MKKVVLIIFLLGNISQTAYSQNYKPKIEPCPCLMKVDGRLKSKCGYLVVPENRKKPNGNKVKIPFIFARRTEQDSTKNITLYTTGGPGYSTINVGDSLTFNSGYLEFGGFIYFNQRGSKNSVPCLDCDGINEAIRESYRKNLPKDSLIDLEATKCHKKFEKLGVDLSSYTTLESAADIADLRKVLKIDSITFLGGSYSGGLMLTVARLYPQGIKSLIIGSPLPTDVNYEEHALFNHDEAINQLFTNIESDSLKAATFLNLKARFRTYFTSIHGQKFHLKYFDQVKKDSLNITYTKNELLDAIFDHMDNAHWQDVPQIIADILEGKHEALIREVLDAKFSGDKSISYGMRYSIYCSEQISFSNIKIVKKQDEILPWLAGYPFNNVNHEICDCWKVKPEPAFMKTPVYSNIPVLISAGEYDPWTRPFYNSQIKRTIPNTQILNLKNRAHMAGYGPPIVDFYKNPYQKLVSKNKDVTVE